MIRSFAVLFLLLAGCGAAEEREPDSACPLLDWMLWRGGDSGTIEIDSLPTSFEFATGGFSTQAHYYGDTLTVILQKGLGETGRVQRMYNLHGESSYLIREKRYWYATPVSVSNPSPQVRDSVVNTLYVCKGVVQARSQWPTSADSASASLRELLARFPRPSNLPK